MAAFSALKADNSLELFSFWRDSNWFLYSLTWLNKLSNLVWISWWFWRDSNWFLYSLTWLNKLSNLVWISWCSVLNELVSPSNFINLSSWTLVWASNWVLVVVVSVVWNCS